MYEYTSISTDSQNKCSVYVNIHTSLKFFPSFKFVVWSQIMNLFMNTEAKYSVMENV